MSVQLTGTAALSAAMSAQSEKDLARAETISLPIALIILLLVFGTLVAAGLPLLVAGLAIPSTLAVVWLLAQQMTMSVFVSSVVTMLGLALAIDYSLFMVSRFREELARGAIRRRGGREDRRHQRQGRRLLRLGGRPWPLGPAPLPGADDQLDGHRRRAHRTLSVAYALTFLPAVLGMLGHRVERLAFPASVPRGRAGAVGPAHDGGRPPGRAGGSESRRP